MNKSISDGILKWFAINWFQVVIIIMFLVFGISALNILNDIDLNLGGGNGDYGSKVGISAEIVNGTNLILDDTNKMHDDLDSIKTSIQSSYYPSSYTQPY